MNDYIKELNDFLDQATELETFDQYQYVKLLDKVLIEFLYTRASKLDVLKPRATDYLIKCLNNNIYFSIEEAEKLDEMLPSIYKMAKYLSQIDLTGLNALIFLLKH